MEIKRDKGNELGILFLAFYVKVGGLPVQPTTLGQWGQPFHSNKEIYFRAAGNAWAPREGSLPVVVVFPS